MQTFTTIQEAFHWWVTNIYPNLPADVKKGKLTNAWRNYTHKGILSEASMKEILVTYGHFTIKTIISYNPI